jgi:hypothetical protein
MPNTERNQNPPGQNKQTGTDQGGNQSMQNQPGRDAPNKGTQPSHSGSSKI